MDQNNTLFITNDDGVEEEFEILLTFTNPETGVHYVVYKELDDTDEVYAARYDESSDIAGTLTPVDSDDEFDMIQEVLDAFFEEME